MERIIQTNKRMQETVTALAAQHGLDLGARGAPLQIDLKGQLPLVIEVVGQHVVRVGQYYETEEGLLLPHPALQFHTAFDEWLLLELHLVQGHARAAPTPDRTDLVWYNPAKQHALITFLEEWGQTIKVTAPSGSERQEAGGQERES